MANSYRPEGSLLPTFENREYLASLDGLERALEEQKILEAPAILCDHRFDLHIELPGGMRGVIPHAEVQYLPDGGEIKDIAVLTRVGKPVCFKVLGFQKGTFGEPIAVLSRRAAQRECMQNYISALVPGDIIPTKVTHLENFGAFVDIGCGIVSLLSIDSISVSRISHPSDRLAVGAFIYTVVKTIDERGRIYVSERELLGSWEENAARFSEGQTVAGIIRSIENYGIFVELAPNLAGLAEIKENAHVDETAAVFIKSIIPDKMKIKLIIIDSHAERRKTEKLEYFIDPSVTPHIDTWTYSPKSAKRVIQSVFGAENTL